MQHHSFSQPTEKPMQSGGLYRGLKLPVHTLSICILCGIALLTALFFYAALTGRNGASRPGQPLPGDIKEDKVLVALVSPQKSAPCLYEKDPAFCGVFL